MYKDLFRFLIKSNYYFEFNFTYYFSGWTNESISKDFMKLFNKDSKSFTLNFK